MILRTFVLSLIGLLHLQGATDTPINREALVRRHDVTIHKPLANSVLQVGNGEFAFGVDITGLQTTAGNTMSQWGWHRNPLPKGMNPADFRMKEYEVHGRKVGYATDAKGQEALFAWLRENPHRINLGRLRWIFDGKPLAVQRLTSIQQKLDLWNGWITTNYQIDGEPVTIITCAHPKRDAVATRVESKLLESGRLVVEIAFPYGDPGSSGANWKKPQAHRTVMQPSGENAASFQRKMDEDAYDVRAAWSKGFKLREVEPHVFLLEGKTAMLELVCDFSNKISNSKLQSFAEIKDLSSQHWPSFWKQGGAIDLSGSKDPRWRELERRIVLSQYLLAVNEAGSLPPQESGLFNNGWNGKFHLEMHWWHGAHYALWDRWPMFDRSLGWYFQSMPEATRLAKSQGYEGLRWPKMVGPDARDAPSGTGPLLIWQQPNPIFYAELDYRLHPTPETLRKWSTLIEQTANFMASFAHLDPASGTYVLGPAIKTVPENTNPVETRNPTFELSYWRTGLKMALEWRKRMGLEPIEKWQQVLSKLSPLPVADGVYLQQEGMMDTYTRMNWEHPSLIGMLGMLPGDGVDPAIMKATVKKVMTTWQWNKVWGWDFPMMAMAAARNGEQAMAVDALLHASPRNGMNEFGLSTGGPFPYFPSNGGLLYAVALMAAGWDGDDGKPAPGFPGDGSWSVKWEGLRKAP